MASYITAASTVKTSGDYAAKIRVIKTPIRAISKAMDLYVKGVINFSNAYHRPLRTMVEVAPNSHRLPRSFTTSFLPDNDQLPEGALVRSISAGEIGGKSTNTKLTNFELYIIQRHCRQMQSCALRKATSCNVGMGKIDEDRASSFRDDNIVVKNILCIKDEDSIFLKSRSDIDSILFLE
ncbi:hypothetical protein L1987_35121 [Smallanthus sonchifolius]|uniref:Uncharacterized protein n=1 Tax=Smallanthus sonchifolius TaxID=185202 RepID=A0ACB9HW74_9ASTR|nr:hypothetical protein L1987_35121 [Smallanthus sonchifolius]